MQKSPGSTQSAVEAAASAHGFSADAAQALFDALVRGNGRMAQFDHPELGGSGQTMAGGMVMIGDMFNSGLKERVAGLSEDLIALIDEKGLSAASEGSSPASESRPMRRQAASDNASSGSNTAEDAKQERPPPADDGIAACRVRWGAPQSSGAQNDIRYAYFAQRHRLVVEQDGRPTIYDTQDHDINGFSQSQSSHGSVEFSSQHGTVDLQSLPRVSSGAQ